MNRLVSMLHWFFIRYQVIKKLKYKPEEAESEAESESESESESEVEDEAEEVGINWDLEAMLNTFIFRKNSPFYIDDKEGLVLVNILIKKI